MLENTERRQIKIRHY